MQFALFCRCDVKPIAPAPAAPTPKTEPHLHQPAAVLMLLQVVGFRGGEAVDVFKELVSCINHPPPAAAAAAAAAAASSSTTS